MVDLNADLGETPGDIALMGTVTSANVACGAHAGDRRTMSAAAGAAREHGVKLGAHPSYLDRAGFGRVELGEPPGKVARDVFEQVSALCEIAEVSYVKLHGALYHRANREAEMAEAILDLLPVHHVLAQPGRLLELAEKRGFRTTIEGFCDRAYDDAGHLVHRSEPGAVLTNPDEVVAQALRLSREMGSLCVHGDTPGAVGLARRIREALESSGVEVRPFS